MVSFLKRISLMFLSSGEINVMNLVGMCRTFVKALKIWGGQRSISTRLGSLKGTLLLLMVQILI